MDASSVSCSVYPTSPRINGGLARLGGGGPYNTFNRHMLTSKVATLSDGSHRGLYTNEGATTDDANSVELQHLFYGSSKFLSNCYKIKLISCKFFLHSIW